ncbi:MAG: hypothetical protein NVS2B3_16470 [Vulcanimicrobiaceae bacterium]
MKRSAASVPLFKTDEDSRFDEKLRAFAREVAKRHRSRPADVVAMTDALRGYHKTWSLFERLPPLDERALAVARAAYDDARSPGKRTKAA